MGTAKIRHRRRRRQERGLQRIERSISLSEVPQGLTNELYAQIIACVAAVAARVGSMDLSVTRDEASRELKHLLDHYPDPNYVLLHVGVARLWHDPYRLQWNARLLDLRSGGVELVAAGVTP